MDWFTEGFRTVFGHLGVHNWSQMAPKWVQDLLNSLPKLLSRRRLGVKVPKLVQNGPANSTNPKMDRTKSMRRSKDWPRDTT